MNKNLDPGATGQRPSIRRLRYPLWFLLAGGPCLLLAVAAATIAVISYWQAQNSLQRVSQRVRQAALERITLHLGSLFERTETANQVTVSIVSAGLLETHEIDGWLPFLLSAAQLEPDTSNLALATAEAEYLGIDKTVSGALLLQRAGSTSAAALVVNHVSADAAVGEVASRTPGYDPRVRPWYRLAAQTRAPAWSAVYAHYAEPTLQIAHSVPVMDRAGQVTGVFVRATRLAHLSQYLGQLELPAQASAFVMERDGSLVAWTRQEPIFSVEGAKRRVKRRNIFELSEFSAPAERSALEALLRTADAPRTGLAREVTIDGERHYLDVRPYSNTGGIDWRIVTLFPKSAFAREVEEGLSTALSLSALVVLAALGLMLLFARRALGAIGELKAATDSLAAGTQLATPAPSAVAELDDLAANFTAMAQQIRERTSALETAVHENRALLDNAMVGICYVRDRVIINCNRQMEALFGYEEGKLRGQSTSVLYPNREVFDDVGRHAAETLAREGICRAEAQLRHRSGRLFWGSMEGRLIDPGNLQGGRVWILSDISERKSAEEKLLLWAKVFESSGEAIVITDASTRIVAVNPAFSEITGFCREEALGQTPRILVSGRHDGGFFRAMWQALNESGQWRGELWNRRKSGEIYPAWLTVSAVSAASGEITHYVGVVSDISPLKKSQEHLDFLAHHDILTGLPNRVLLSDRLMQGLARAKRENHCLAVLFIDLDGFKDINDTLGHHMGDELLKCIAQKLTSTMRASDTVARQGGDEFILLLEEIDGIRGTSVFATKLLGLFGEAFHLGGHDIHVTASVGITIFPDDGDDPDTLIRNADTAMYQAKAGGRNACRFYSPDMVTPVRRMGL